VVACDMPNVTAAVLRALLDRAEATQADAVIPIGPSGIPDPLCAVYRRTCLGPGLEALAAKRLKVTDAFAKSVIDWWKVEDRRWLVNTNTPEEWTAVVGAQTVDD
jgi:molybdopterin-guanine dinucleotide biosynthesis protein A